MPLTTHLKTLALSSVTLLILLLLILWMAGAFQGKIKPETLKTGALYQGPTRVVERTAVPVFESAAGTLEAKQGGDISAQIQARIKAIHVKSGEIVKPGDLLITLDDETIAARTAQARANLDALEARLAGSSAHYRRTQYLYARDSATRADLDAARSDYESLKSQQSAARSQLREAGHIQEYGRIRATFPARVVDRHAEPGEIAYPGRKLLTLYDPAGLRIEAFIRETVAVNLRVGQVLEADIEALDLTIPATIEEMVPAAHPDARNFHLKMRIEYQSGLYPGLFARIRIPQGEAQVLAIPQDYILKVGQLDIVWILQRGRIERRFIRLGRPLSDGRIGIISGLEGGERLVSPENARASLD